MKTLLTTLLLPAAVLAYSGGAPNGLTGAPGEGNCTQCHAGNGLNDSAGLFQIGIPAVYEPGESYTITVLLGQPDQSRWGFELTDQGAGSFSSVDGTTQVSGDYVKQTAAGTMNGTTGPVSWEFEWTAPDEFVGPVTLYAAGNAANGNGGTSGDYIHTTSMTIEESTSVGSGVRPEAIALLSNAPNPFNPTTELKVELTQGGPVQLAVYDLSGRQVTQLVSEMLPAGSHSFTWNGLSASGAPLPSGVYLARLDTPGQSVTHRMTLLK